MTLSTSRSTTKRTVAAAAAVAAASTLAACGSDSKSAADAPSVSSKATSATSQAAAPSQTAKPSAAPSKAATAEKRASRSQVRQALPAVTTQNITWSRLEVVPNRTVYVYSTKMAKGTSVVTQEGRKGLVESTYASTKRGGQIVSSTLVKSQVERAAIRRVVTVGAAAPVAPKTMTRVTRVAVVPQRAVTMRTHRYAMAATPSVSRSQVRSALTQHRHVVRAAAATVTPPRAAAAGGSGNSAMWNHIASCESTNNWHINSGNGFYGGLQFTQSTWAGYGGTAYAGRADLASPAQQMAVADKVLASQGRGAWPVCGH